MPRLVGKKSNAAAYTTLGIVAALLAGVVLEYTGVIDLVPGFGPDKVQTQDGTINKPIAPAAR